MDYKEKLKAIINSNKTPFVDIDTFLKYFPELAESEDEKRRKWTINYLENRILNSGNIDEKEACRNAIAWLEKQKYSEHRLGDELCQCYHDDKHPTVEQKPVEWSDEDEQRLEDIIVFVSGYADKRVNKEWVDWLKSLRPQPKQGLSEDEKGIIATALSNTYSDDIATKLLNKIKSLRPQNQWKPSEEQMEALKSAYNGDKLDLHERRRLSELYESLKALL